MPAGLTAENMTETRPAWRSVNAEGKLVDTNNSTNDFTPNATPSLK